MSNLLVRFSRTSTAYDNSNLDWYNFPGLGHPAMRAGGYALATGLGFDVLREFWPDIAHKLHMPFRDSRERLATEAGRSRQ